MAIALHMTRLTTMIADDLAALLLSIGLCVTQLHWHGVVTTLKLLTLLLTVLRALSRTIAQCCFSSLSQYNSISEGIRPLQKHLGAYIRLQAFQELKRCG